MVMVAARVIIAVIMFMFPADKNKLDNGQQCKNKDGAE
jgi:hypothetical protein